MGQSRPQEPVCISELTRPDAECSFVSTRTDEELKLLLVPELADKLTACEESCVQL